MPPVATAPPTTITDASHGDGRIKRLPKADPRREYVSGGQFAWTQFFFRSLPWWVDDLSRDFGDDIYDRMLLDPQVSACITLLKAAILHGGINVAPRVQEGEEGYEQAVELADFCRRNLESLEDSFVTTILWDLLDALPYGNKVAEQIYELRDGGPDAGKLCLRNLKVKPRKTTAFVVDAFNNVFGLLALVPGQGYTVLSSSLVGDPASIPNLLPRRKFAILSFRPKSGDPRGSSILRAVYYVWWLKQQTWPELLRFITQFAGPSVWGTTAEGAQEYPQEDPETGEILLDADDQPITINPEEAMLTTLQDWRNGYAAAFPFGSEVHVEWPRGEGAPFESAIDLFDRQMAEGILLQSLATMESRFGTRAQAGVHQDVLGLLVQLLRTWVEEFIERDILKPLVEYNFGADALPLVPKVTFGDTGEEDLAAALTGLAAVGFSVDASQFPGIDGRLGLPKRSEESLTHAQAMQQASLEGVQAKNEAIKSGDQPDEKANGKQPAGSG